MVKVSVIVPVYGVAPYIGKCTNSLLSQTLDDMEFIFVDDHGPDGSIEMARHTIAGHSRERQFRFLDPGKNLGAGAARNYAIPFAEGEYIAFVDGDDWVEPDMFSVLYRKAKVSGDADVCYAQGVKDFSDGKPSIALKNPVVESGEFTHDKRAFYLVNYVSYFTTYIYRKDHLLRDRAQFPQSLWAEDSFFISCSLMTAKSVACVDRPMYHYRIRPGSASTTTDGTKYLLRIAVFDKLLQYAIDHGVIHEFKEEINYIYIKKCGLTALIDYANGTLKPQLSTFKEIFGAVSSRIPDYKSNRYYKKSISVKLLLWLSQHMPAIFTWAARKISSSV